MSGTQLWQTGWKVKAHQCYQQGTERHRQLYDSLCCTVSVQSSRPTTLTNTKPCVGKAGHEGSIWCGFIFCTLHNKMVHATTNNQAYCFKANNLIHNLFRKDDCCICSNITICCIHCLHSQLVSRCTEISQPNRHHISLFKLAIQTKYPRGQLRSCHDWALGIPLFRNVKNYEPHFANQLLLYIYCFKWGWVSNNFYKRKNSELVSKSFLRAQSGGRVCFVC